MAFARAICHVLVEILCTILAGYSTGQVKTERERKEIAHGNVLPSMRDLKAFQQWTLIIPKPLQFLDQNDANIEREERFLSLFGYVNYGGEMSGKLTTMNSSAVIHIVPHSLSSAHSYHRIISSNGAADAHGTFPNRESRDH